MDDWGLFEECVKKHFYAGLGDVATGKISWATLGPNAFCLAYFSGNLNIFSQSLTGDFSNIELAFSI